jgi:DNA topoisomerase-1
MSRTSSSRRLVPPRPPASAASAKASTLPAPDVEGDGKAASAEAPVAVPAGLVWVSDAEPGFSRERRGDKMVYLDATGRRIRDEATLARIRKLAVPPAYEAVWICADPNGHLQATGRDARGRKQYRYHALWQQQRGDDKFESMRTFGAVLPRIRRCVRRDLEDASSAQPARTLVLATLVRLLDTTFLRIGNEEYVRGNGSYGLTTLRTRHAGVHRAQVRLSFKGKSGVRHEVKLEDRRVATVVRRCKALPGQELFQYCDTDGSVHKVTSTDVNDYLAEVAGFRVTAKDFRTWHGSVLALEFTRAACSGDPGRGAANQVIARVAERLGNTVAVCRKSYIHPCVLELGAALVDEETRAAMLQQRWAAAANGSQRRSLAAAERRLLALLGPEPSRRPRPGKTLATSGRDGTAICQTLPDRPVATIHRKGSHAKDLGFHDAQRAGRPPGREPAARRASDG